jgi:hypothetical protein
MRRRGRAALCSAVMRTPRSPRTLALLPVVLGLVAACGGGSSSTGSGATTAAPTGAQGGAAPNRAPTIQGVPPTSAATGQPWAFTPLASDPDGDALTFTVTNRPSWASFDSRSGRLAGTPTAGDAGTVSNVTIAVSDGRASAALAPFSLTVTPPATGATTLSWDAPLTNTDGSALTDLAGFRVTYGTDATRLDRSVDVPDPAVSSRRIEGLAPGLWHFAVIAYNRDGVEGLPSGIASLQVR